MFTILVKDIIKGNELRVVPRLGTKGKNNQNFLRGAL